MSNYDQPVFELVELLKKHEHLSIAVGTMSTQIGGNYDVVMNALNNCMKQLMRKYPSVFNLKIANACEVK